MDSTCLFAANKRGGTTRPQLKMAQPIRYCHNYPKLVPLLCLPPSQSVPLCSNNQQSPTTSSIPKNDGAALCNPKVSKAKISWPITASRLLLQNPLVFKNPQKIPLGKPLQKPVFLEGSVWMAQILRLPWARTTRSLRG